MTAELNALADRLEQASEDEQHELLEEAFAALFSKPERVWVTDNTGPWTDEYEAYHERSWRFAGMLEAEAYESAALTLIGEGWRRSIEDMDEGTPPLCRLERHDSDEEHWSRAATWPLALAAAALRARGVSR